MEWFTTECGKYRIESLSAATFPGAMNVLRVAFCQDEALCIATEVNKSPKAIDDLLDLAADVVLDGVSLVAIDTVNNKVVAAAFNNIQEQASSPDKSYFNIFAKEKCTQISSRAYCQFFADFHQKMELFEKYQSDCSLEVIYLASLGEYREKKLGLLLGKYTMELAKRLKNGPVATITLEDLGPAYSKLKPRNVTKKYPKFCQAICTAKASQKIAKNFGWTVHLRLPFEDFLYNGKSHADRVGNNHYYEGVAVKIE